MVSMSDMIAGGLHTSLNSWPHNIFDFGADLASLFVKLNRAERLLRWRIRDIYFAGDRRHQGFGVKAFRAFESPRIETRSFRLYDPQGHHCSAFGASRALDRVYEHCGIPPLGRTFVACRDP